jgi:hypothetical protein
MKAVETRFVGMDVGVVSNRLVAASITRELRLPAGSYE